jgi:hypothetical protein
MLDTSSNADARAMDLIGASGVLNPNITLDKLMDVSRQLAALGPAIKQDSGWKTFIHNGFMYTVNF